MTNDPTMRDLARLGLSMNEKGGELFKTTLCALASPQSGDVRSEECIEFVAAQVYDEAPKATTENANQFVETFLSVFDVDSLGDVDDLLGRESYIRLNYEGHLAFAAENNGST